MDSLSSAFQVFFSLQSALLMLGVFMATYVVRVIVETAAPAVKANKWWREVFLPVGPLATGMILAFVAKGYAWPEAITDMWSRAFYGGACGMASGWGYTRFRSVLAAFGGDRSLPPSPKGTEPDPIPVTVDQESPKP